MYSCWLIPTIFNLFSKWKQPFTCYGLFSWFPVAWLVHYFLLYYMFLIEEHMSLFCLIFCLTLFCFVIVKVCFSTRRVTFHYWGEWATFWSLSILNAYCIRKRSDNQVSNTWYDMTLISNLVLLVKTQASILMDYGEAEYKQVANAKRETWTPDLSPALMLFSSLIVPKAKRLSN